MTTKRKRTPLDKPSKPYQLSFELDEESWENLEHVRLAMGFAHRKEAIQWALLIAASSAMIQEADRMRANSNAARSLLIACVNVSEQALRENGVKSLVP